MRVSHRVPLFGAILMICLATASCRERSKMQQSATRSPPSRSTIVIARPNPIQYVECDEKDAETILNVRVIVRNVVNQDFSLPLKRERPYDEHGVARMVSGPGTVMVSADGVKNGHGIGYDASVLFDDGTETDVTVDVSIAWTAPDNTSGSVDRKVRIPVDRASEQLLTDKVSIKAVFHPAAAVSRRSQAGD